MPYTASDVRNRPRILRALLCAPAKAGKTTVSVITAPGPVHVLNADGKGALDPVVAMGGDFTADDLTGSESAMRSIAWAEANLAKIETVLFDNITTFASLVEQEVRAEVRDDPRVIYPEIERRVMAVIYRLIKIERHVIVIGHMESGENDTPGAMGSTLSVPGKLRTKIPALMQDWIWLHVENTPRGAERRFLLAPQGNWHKAVRSVQNIPWMEANISKFITLMEQGPVKAKQVSPSNGKTAAAPTKPAAAKPAQAKP